MLILVRHGMPTILPGRPPSSWPLSPEGLRSARDLATKLAHYDHATIVASGEAKALGTASAIAEVFGLNVSQDDGFAEHHNETGEFLERFQFERLIEKMFEDRKSLIVGEKTGEQACRRFQSALAR